MLRSADASVRWTIGIGYANNKLCHSGFVDKGTSWATATFGWMQERSGILTPVPSDPLGSEPQKRRRISTHSLFPSSDSDIFSSSTSLTTAGIDKLRYNWRT